MTTQFPDLPDIGNKAVAGIIAGVFLASAAWFFGLFKKLRKAISTDTAKEVGKELDKSGLEKDRKTVKLFINEGENLRKFVSYKVSTYQSDEFKSANSRWELNVSSFLSKISPIYNLDQQYKAWSMAGTGGYKKTQDPHYWQEKYSDELRKRIAILSSVEDQLNQVSVE